MAKNSSGGTFKTCTCDKCGVVAHALSGSFHRRCTSQMSEDNKTIRPKHNLLPKNQRGKWS